MCCPEPIYGYDSSQITDRDVEKKLQANPGSRLNPSHTVAAHVDELFVNTKGLRYRAEMYPTSGYQPVRQEDRTTYDKTSPQGHCRSASSKTSSADTYGHHYAASPNRWLSKPETYAIMESATHPALLRSMTFRKIDIFGADQKIYALSYSQTSSTVFTLDRPDIDSSPPPPP